MNSTAANMYRVFEVTCSKNKLSNRLGPPDCVPFEQDKPAQQVAETKHEVRTLNSPHQLSNKYEFLACTLTVAFQDNVSLQAMQNGFIQPKAIPNEVDVRTSLTCLFVLATKPSSSH